MAKIKANGVGLHHRIGGLENDAVHYKLIDELHHRIGGLEKDTAITVEIKTLHHRIGGLESSS